MSPHLRRIIYVVAFEITAIILVIIALTLMGFDGANSGLTAVATSTVAMIWNYAWNTIFEGWEQRQPSTKRTVKRRIAHAAGFETGLIILLVPLMAWILQVTLVEAFILDIGLMVFFLIYTFVFAWVFDLVLPRTRPADSEEPAAAE